LEPKLLFKKIIYPLLRAKNFLFSCVRVHTHVIIADTSHDFMTYMATTWRPFDQNWSGFANKIAKIIKIWIKRSVKQFLKGKSRFKNNFTVP